MCNVFVCYTVSIFASWLFLPCYSCHLEPTATHFSSSFIASFPALQDLACRGPNTSSSLETILFNGEARVLMVGTSLETHSAL